MGVSEVVGTSRRDAEMIVGMPETVGRSRRDVKAVVGMPEAEGTPRKVRSVLVETATRGEWQSLATASVQETSWG